MRKAYGYIRFSDEQQEEGTSHQRQLEDIRKYCVTHGLELQDKVYFDSGKSAFHGQHLKGELGLFIKDCQRGIIPAKSVLVLEKMDRLTRLGNINAQELLKTLLENVDIHFIDGQLELTYDRYNKDFGTAINVAAKIFGAYDYSRTLSERCKRAIDIKLVKARKGEGKLPGRFPCWLVRDGEVFSVDQDKKAILMQIVALKESGLGVAGITKYLNEHKIPPISKAKQWNKPFIKHLFQEPALYGGLQKYVYTKGSPRRYGEIIEGYYPPIIDKARWKKISYNREHLGQKGRPCGVNPFVKVLVCAECGRPLYTRGAILGTGKSVKYVHCNYSTSGNDCGNSRGFNLGALIDGFLAFNSCHLEVRKSDDVSGEIAEIDAEILASTEKLDEYKRDYADSNRVIRDEARKNVRDISSKMEQLALKRENLMQVQRSRTATVDMVDLQRLFRDRKRIVEANEFVRLHYSKLELQMEQAKLTIEMVNGKRFLIQFTTPSRNARKNHEIPRVVEITRIAQGV